VTRPRRASETRDRARGLEQRCERLLVEHAERKATSPSSQADRRDQIVAFRVQLRGYFFFAMSLRTSADAAAVSRSPKWQKPVQVRSSGRGALAPAYAGPPVMVRLTKRSTLSRPGIGVASARMKTPTVTPTASSMIAQLPGVRRSFSTKRPWPTRAERVSAVSRASLRVKVERQHRHSAATHRGR